MKKNSIFQNPLCLTPLKLLFLFMLVSMPFGCSESDDDSNTDTEQPSEQDPNATIADNIVVLESSNSSLVSDENEINNGIYTFEFSDNVPEISIDDIIVGDEGLGFLRRVTSVDTSDNALTLETIQANMEDVFGNVEIDFSTDLSDIRSNSNPPVSDLFYERLNYERFAEGVSKSRENGFALNLANILINSNSSGNISISNGSISFNPNYVFDIDYSLFSLQKFSFGTENSTFNASTTLNINTNDQVTFPFIEYVLYENSKTFVRPIGKIPLVITVFFKLKTKSDLAVGNAFALSKTYEYNSNFSLGGTYENENWTPIAELSSDFVDHPVDLDGSYVNITSKYSIVPEVVIAFYGINGPLLEPTFSGDFGLNLGVNDDWDAYLNRDFKLSLGASIGILGESLITLPYDDYLNNDPPVMLWSAPQNIEEVSGNNQSGSSGQALEQPLKVRILDSSGTFYLEQVPVYFEVNEGGGTVNQEIVLTDDDGYAETIWTLGDNTDPQSVEAKVKKADGSYIESIVLFNATTEGTSAENLEIVSGDNQTGGQGEELEDALVVVAKDNDGNAVSGEQVIFEVTSGGGTLSQETVVTDESGSAQTSWSLGNNQDDQTVQASISDNDGNIIDYVNFNATAESIGCGGLTSFTDPRDGQVYPVVQIGSQCWFAKNLNYATASGSWCYDDDPVNCTTYGRLYNWQTALTACPPGYHLPSDAEWTELTDYLGGEDIAGGKMKSTTSWNAPNTGANNSSGFSGFPGGLRFSYEVYIDVGSYGYWWSSSEVSATATTAIDRVLGYDIGYVDRGGYYKTSGLSCRCLRD